MKEQDLSKALKSKLTAEANSLPPRVHAPTAAVVAASLCHSIAEDRGVDFEDAAEALLTWSGAEILRWARGIMDPAEDADLITILGGDPA